MGKEVKKILDDFVKANGTGVQRRGPRGDKQWKKTNVNISVRLCNLIIGNTRLLIMYALKGKAPLSNRNIDKMEEVFYGYMYEFIADYNQEENMSFSNYFIDRMWNKFRDETKKEGRMELMPMKAEASDDDEKSALGLEDFPEETDYTEAETEENILQFCSLLFMALKSFSKGKGRMYRMFYTEQFLIFCDSYGDIFDSAENRHSAELWDNLDKVLLSCIYCDTPKNSKELLHFIHKTKEILKSYYDSYAQSETALRGKFVEIFEGSRNLDAEINVPLESRIFIASDYIRQHDIDGITEPKALSNAYITQTKRGRFNKDGSLAVAGFDQIKEKISYDLGLLK